MRTRARSGIKAGAGLATVLLAACAAWAAPRGVATSGPIYWGAHIGDLHGLNSEAPWNMRNARAFERGVGKRVSLIEFGIAWRGSCSFAPCYSDGMSSFPRKQLEAVRRHGAIPVLSWASGDRTQSTLLPMKAVANGAYDRYLRRWAHGAKAWGRPFFLRFDWEMNAPGTRPWAATGAGNSPRQFVRMWRHVRGVFTAAGATNVTWVWCPNVEYVGSIKPLSSLYPGTSYVDWTCLDGYNWGTNPKRPAGWISFAALFGPTYLKLRVLAPKKPVMIAETASTSYGGSKPDWIADAFGQELPNAFPAVKAVMWFDRVDDGMDWPISTDPAALKSFAAAIASPYYAANTFSHLRTSPIRSPGG
jgi:hypothetical protein